jgi:integrase
MARDSHPKVPRSAGRPLTGSIVWQDPQKTTPVGVRVTIGDGTRTLIPFDPGTTCEQALALAPLLAQRARFAVDQHAPETVEEWFVRWADARTAKGLSSVRNDRARYKKWIAPAIGAEPIATIPRRRIEDVVQSLDRAVQLGKLRWKTAINVWGVLSKMMKDASRSKVLALRVREDNPAREVQGPDRGVERAAAYLFPNEFLALMDCARVPARWKRLVMLATYLYVRVGELEALEWNAVDVEHGYVLIHQSAHADTGVVQPTKTKDVRKVPIDPNLLPLLEHMRDQASSEGRVVTALPPRESLAKRLRKYLAWAGVTRAELFAEDETRRAINFHDLRHTGITWRAVRGDEPLKVQRAAGHDDLATTQRYINEAQTFEGVRFGEAFPPVALASLVGFGVSFGFLASVTATGACFSGDPVCPQGDSNPR